MVVTSENETSIPSLKVRFECEILWKITQQQQQQKSIIIFILSVAYDTLILNDLLSTNNLDNNFGST